MPRAWFDVEELRELIHEERAEQGLPPTIEDPVGLRSVARLLTAGGSVQYVKNRRVSSAGS